MRFRELLVLDVGACITSANQKWMEMLGDEDVGSICCERNQTKLRKKKEETPGIICVGCEQQCFASPEIHQRVRDRQEESTIELSNQSKERALVGEVIRSPTGRKKIAQRFIAGFPGDGGTSPARDERT